MCLLLVFSRTQFVFAWQGKNSSRRRNGNEKRCFLAKESSVVAYDEKQRERESGGNEVVINLCKIQMRKYLMKMGKRRRWSCL